MRALCLLPHPGFEGVVLVSAVFLRHAHNPLMLAANKDTEQASTPWCESSPDDLRYGNLMYPDHREREKDQHEKNKRWVTVCLRAVRLGAQGSGSAAARSLWVP